MVGLQINPGFRVRKLSSTVGFVWIFHISSRDIIVYTTIVPKKLRP